MDIYYGRNEVSNSDLSWLKNQLYPHFMPDPTNAFKFGNLIDAMITEGDKVDYFQHTVDDVRYSKEDFDLAEEMKRVFYRDEMCRTIAANAKGQAVMTKHQTFNFRGYEFELDTRCKWDLWADSWQWGGDIKSTACTTQKQFEEACRFFDYDRSRAWYMDIAGSKRDIIIGISKKNLRLFKVPITRDSTMYKDGVDKYKELAFRWHLLYGTGRPDKEAI